RGGRHVPRRGDEPLGADAAGGARAGGGFRGMKEAAVVSVLGVLIKLRSVAALMTALAHYADSSRTSPEVRDVPNPDSCSAALWQRHAANACPEMVLKDPICRGKRVFRVKL